MKQPDLVPCKEDVPHTAHLWHLEGFWFKKWYLCSGIAPRTEFESWRMANPSLALNIAAIPDFLEPHKHMYRFKGITSQDKLIFTCDNCPTGSEVRIERWAYERMTLKPTENQTWPG